jgi:serine/threonine protein phosphatase PrpC
MDDAVNGGKVVRNFITSEPEIRVVDLDPETDDFFFLASDGLFDRYSSNESVEIISDKLSQMEVMEQDV